jgi:putative addiction module component (TIGR02574 family)
MIGLLVALDPSGVSQKFASYVEPRSRVAAIARHAIPCENPVVGPKVDIKSLTAEERLTLLGDIWDSLDPEAVPVTDLQREELDRRLDDLEGDRDLGIPWEEVFRRIRDRSK